jgi:23S rRNA (adenine1618-N6)-methyltransferase
VSWKWQPGLASTGVGFSKEDVWSRKARRRLQRQINENPAAEREQTSTTKDEKRAAFGFKVRLKQEKEALEDGPTIVVRWLKGTDHVLFESFVGMLKRSCVMNW